MSHKQVERLAGESSSHPKPRSDKVLNLITIPDSEDRYTFVRLVSNIKYLLSISKDVNEALSLYFSFLCICLELQGIKDKILKSARQSGYVVVDTPWDTSKWVENLREESPELLLESAVIVVIGQLLFIPFRDWGYVDYDQFMSKRTSALCSKIGGRSIGLPMVAETAIKLGAFLHRLRSFKIVIIDDVLRNPEYKGMPGMETMVASVGNILSWTDMGTYTMIRDELVMSSSVLLGMEELVPEWENFNLAVMAVTRFQYPRYFGIVADIQELKSLRKSNFPTLAGVAQLSATFKTNASAIVRLQDQLGPDIKRYFVMHKRVAFVPGDRMLARCADFLPKRISNTTFEEIQFAKWVVSCEEPLRSKLIEEKCEEHMRKRQKCAPNAGKESDEIAPGVRKLTALTNMIPKLISAAAHQENVEAEFIRGLEEPVRSIVYEIRGESEGKRSRPA